MTRVGYLLDQRWRAGLATLTKRGRFLTVLNRLARIIWTLFIIVLFGASAAHAQKLIEPETSTIVITSAEEITEVTSTKGTVLVNKDGDGRNVLVFIAPSDIPKEAVKVTYKVGNEEKETASYSVQSAASTFGSSMVYEASFKALFTLFILAVVIESGLQLIFRWRPYLSTFNTAGVNALIAFAFSWFFVGYFQLDIATRLVNAYLGAQSSYANTPIGYALTALIIAGGSAGVNRVFRAFGIRPIGPPAEIVGPRHDDTAWISVSIKRERAKGTISVLYGKENHEAVIGTISGKYSDNVLRNLFLRNKGRFPQSGGYRVAVTDEAQVIKVLAKDENNNDIPIPMWGPHPIGSRAIIDVERTA